MIAYRGETLCVTDWAERIGVKYHTLVSRFNRGWDVEKAFLTPLFQSSNDPVKGSVINIRVAEGRG